MTTLEQRIRQKRKSKDILIVSHVVMGYPDFEVGAASVGAMAKAGVDVIELQIPFSDPGADGPFLTRANQQAVENGTTVEQCFEFAEKMCAQYPQIDFLFMTYYNIVFMFGIQDFIERAASIGIRGMIIPDLPLEEADDYLVACKTFDVAPIFLFTPLTSDERMERIADVAEGFLYCQARLGTTGKQTDFQKETENYIQRARSHTDVPLGMGFGIRTKADVDFLKGKVDLVMCCTKALQVLLKDGPEAMGIFLKSLR